MKGHLRRCRCASGPHVRPSTLRSGAQGAQRAPVEYCHGPTVSALCALHLALPEQAPSPKDSDTLLSGHR